MLIRAGGDAAARLQSLCEHIRTVAPGSPPILSVIQHEVRDLMRADAAVAYGLSASEEGLQFDFVHTTLPLTLRDRAGFKSFFASPGRKTNYDPLRVDPAQANRPLTSLQVATLPGSQKRPPIHSHLDKLGLGSMDQLRALLAEGDSLLAWFGALREEPFTDLEVSRMKQIVAPLQERMVLERALEALPISTAALAASLESIAGAAFVLAQAPLQIVLANAAARALLQRDRTSTVAALRAALRGGPGSLTRLEVPGARAHALVVLRNEASLLAHRLGTAVARWRLSPKQAEVLSLVAKGLSNRAIASALGRSEKTLEKHVAALLEKSGSGSRAGLLAALLSIN